MKAVCLRGRGGAEVVETGVVPLPKPGPGEILVRVHAAAVTPAELGWRPTWSTTDGQPRPFPVVPGHELSGAVAALGPGVTRFEIGDAVYGMNDWFRQGTQAELCIARAIDVAAKPASIGHAEAATLPISALAAWQGLLVRGRLGRDERVLVHGGAGGVGLLAVQLAKRQGAHVIATASEPNLGWVRVLGADQVIDRRRERFEDVARDLDVVFDTVGGETLERSWDLLKPDGRMVTVASGQEPRDERTRQAFFLVEPGRGPLERIARLVDAGELRPFVGARFPLAAARVAYEARPGRGKAVLELVKG